MAVSPTTSNVNPLKKTDKDHDGVYAEDGDDDSDPSKGSKTKSPDKDRDGKPWGPEDLTDQTDTIDASADDDGDGIAYINDPDPNQNDHWG